MWEEVILIESFVVVDDVKRRLYLEIMTGRFLGWRGEIWRLLGSWVWQRFSPHWV